MNRHFHSKRARSVLILVGLLALCFVSGQERGPRDSDASEGEGDYCARSSSMSQRPFAALDRWLGIILR
jgi:hypothetical protein